MAKSKKPATRRTKETARVRASRAVARDTASTEIPAISAEWIEARERCADSLEAFCLTFLPEWFFLPFSEDHRRAIARFEQVVKGGSTFCLAMPRGSGKTALAKAAALWAILYGYCKFVVIIAAKAHFAKRIMAEIKEALERGEELNSAFPEATYLIRKLGGNVSLVRFAKLDGEPSGLEWGAEGVRLARVPSALCSGAIIRCAGMGSAIRGMTAAGSRGEILRPDLCLADDPQDRAAADSPQQIEDLERILNGDVARLAGPKKSLGIMMPVTCIRPNDLAERYLDREKRPQWCGERTSLVSSFPTEEAEKLWNEYFELRAADFRAGGDGSSATDYYRTNRAAMDDGCSVSWPERFDEAKYASAIEEALVAKHDDPESFWAELQNQPLKPESEVGKRRQLEAAVVAGKVSGLQRATLPAGSVKHVAFIDVGGEILYWGIAAFDNRWNGAILDYGTYPPQTKSYFSNASPSPSLSSVFPGYTEPQRIFAGLKALTDDLFARRFVRESGELVALDRVLIDLGWKTETVHQFIRESPHLSKMLASKGYSTQNNPRGMDGWQGREGETPGLNHVVKSAPNGRGKMCLFDPDFWKSFAADRLETPPGGAGCLQLFNATPETHRLFSDHCSAEFCQPTTNKSGRKIAPWLKERSSRENHFWDVVVGCCLAASTLGLPWSPSGEVIPPPPKKPKPKPISLLEMTRAANPGRQVW